MTDDENLDALALTRWAAFQEDDLGTLRTSLRAAIDHVDLFTQTEAERLIGEIDRELEGRSPLAAGDPSRSPRETMQAVARRNNHLVSRGWYLEDDRWQHADLAATTGVDAAEAERIQSHWDVNA